MVRRLVVFSLSLSILPLGACSDERITGPQTGLHVVHPMSVITASAGDGTIAFARTDTQNDIWLMNPDGTGKINITNAPTSEEGSPSWSPDGTRIVFVSNRDDINGEIYVMNADGTGVTRLTNNTFLDGSPAWSPLGNKIAFISQRLTNNLDIFVMNPDGTNQTRLTTHAGNESAPAWSPDGSRIAFHDFDDYDIYTVNADGTGLTNVTNSPTFQELSPSWSPDGSKIAISRHTGTTFEIFVMNPDGTGLTSITPNNSSMTPVWSPDGTRMVIERPVPFGTPLELFVMNSDGTGAVNVGNTAANEYSSGASWWGPRDRDSDGIDNVIDTAPATPSLEFSDIPLGGKTAGSIESIPANVSVAIHEAIPGGVRVTTTATGTVSASARVVIRLNGKSQLEKLVIPGTYVITDPETSVTIDVESGGPAEVELTLNGSPIVVSISEGASATVDETTDANGVLTAVTVSDVTGDSGDVTINGEPVEPGSQPVPVSTLAAKLAVRRGQLTLSGTFTPAASGVVNPGTDDITLNVGEYSFVTTGGLARNKSGAYTFDGTTTSAPGVQISLELKQAKAGGGWTVKATASPVSGFVNPVTVSLHIGDISASAQVTATLR
jgi:Tol biopolymer transport system component